MRRKVVVFLFFVLLGLARGVSLANVLPPSTDFAFKLFTQVYGGREENLLISPFSVALALGMTANGARGETQEAVLRALGSSSFSIDTLNAENERFVAMLEGLTENDPGVEVKVANALFGRAGISFREKFLRTLRERYRASARNLDFGDPLAVAEINRWVEEKTEGKIEKILERLDPDAILVLLNTLFFRGSWSVPFEEKDTRPIPFHFPDGTVKDHPIMFQSGWYRYLSTDGFQAVSLPYGEMGQIRLYLFLPAPQVSLGSFLSQLSAENWARWRRGFARRNGTIGVPRFRLSYGVVDLKEALGAMGMEVAFSPQADFGDLVDGPAFIENVFHRTVMEVNEEGTEAAAATAVVIAKGVGEEAGEAFTMVIDRPFFLVLTHEESGLPLFLGAVFAPHE